MDPKTRDDRSLQAVVFRSLANRYDKRATLIGIFAIIMVLIGHTGWAIFFGCIAVPFVFMAFSYHLQADRVDPENHISYWKNNDQN